MQSKASFDDRCPAKRYELSQCLYVMSARNGLVTLRTIWAVGEQKLRRITGLERADEETHARLGERACFHFKSNHRERLCYPCLCFPLDVLAAESLLV